MRYLNRHALGALTAIGLLASSAGAQQKPAGMPAVAPIGDAGPPANLPAGAGPSGTSRTLAGPARFDQVGYAAIGTGEGISASGPGLPAPGFAEVTDLATGRTILIRTSAGPTGKPGFLVDLSPEAAHLLGLSGSGPAQVRVRQVEPIAADQVAIEQGRPAAPRLDAPPILLTGLRAQMAQVPAPRPTGPAAAPPPPPASAIKPAPPPAHVASTAKTDSAASHGKPGASYPAPGTAAKPAVPKVAKPQPAPAVAKPASVAKVAPKVPARPSGKYRVRVGAFSSAANARALAGKLGGHASQSGKYWLVELGPFADAAAAKSARDGAARRGYGDARVIAN
jgi:rare lipoprotein A